jgi:hypothetical protein
MATRLSCLASPVEMLRGLGTVAARLILTAPATRQQPHTRLLLFLVSLKETYHMIDSCDPEIAAWYVRMHGY